MPRSWVRLNPSLLFQRKSGKTQPKTSKQNPNHENHLDPSFCHCRALRRPSHPHHADGPSQLRRMRWRQEGVPFPDPVSQPGQVVPFFSLSFPGRGAWDDSHCAGVPFCGLPRSLFWGITEGPCRNARADHPTPRYPRSRAPVRTG